MAAITASEITTDPEGHVKVYMWTGVTESDTCTPVRFTDKDDITLSVHGTLGGSSWALHLSGHDSTLTDYYVATNQADTTSAIALTVDNTAALVLETAAYFGPVRTGGTSVSVDLVLTGK